MPNLQALNDPLFAQGILADAKIFFLQNNFQTAFRLWGIIRDVENKLKSQINENVMDIYGQAKQWCFWVAFPALPDTIVLDGFTHGLSAVLGDDVYDVIDKVKRKLFFKEVVEDRDEFRRHLRDVLLVDKEILTHSPGAERTVGEWLDLYQKFSGSEDFGRLKQAEFISKNTVNLSEQDRHRVEKLLKLFDYLKLSSASAEGLEDEIIVEDEDGFVMFSDGVLERIDPLEDPIYAKRIPAMVNTLKESWAMDAQTLGPLEQEADEYRRSISLTYEQASTKIQETLATSGSSDPKQIIAALMVIFETGDIEELLKKTGAENLRKAGELLLVQKAGLPSAHAAAVIGRLIPRIPATQRSPYLMVAYYDMSKGRFIWEGESVEQGMSEQLG